jgi:signal transduction histidine kinase/AmiR/NasT family two-component response regulator
VHVWFRWSALKAGLARPQADHRVLLTVFAILTAAVLSVTMVVLVSLSAIHSTAVQATHSYEVLDAAHGLSGSITSERAIVFRYAMAPSARSLQLYRQVQAQTDRHLERLDILSRDSATQRRRLGEVRTNLVRWRADLARPSHPPHPGAHGGAPEEAAYFTAARMGMTAFEALENSLLQKREKAAEQAYSVAVVALLASAAAVVLIGGAFWWGAATVLIRARTAAEAASLAKSQFLSNMSHEIRTPLNGVLGMAQVMARDELSAIQRERLTRLQDSGEHLTTLLGDVLDFARIEGGKLELHTQPLDIVALAEGVAANFRTTADAKGLWLKVEVAQDTPAIWLGDCGRIRQILHNLVGNALKFTEAGGVRLEVAASADGLLSLRVVDTGPGIDPAAAASVFEHFRQANNSSTRSHGGLGLGLTIARDLARQMGGDLVVHSTPGQGAVFEATLRLPPATPVAAEEDEGPDVALRVLVAEDNPINQRVMAALLGALGVDIMIVENGLVAVEAWKQQDFDLVLMDLQMPEMDGLDATRAIRRLEQTAGAAATPIVAVSANAMPHHVEECLAVGMDGHIAKPVQVAELAKALHDAAGRRRAAATAPVGDVAASA